jgi:holo-[acyl-carrier protein] synthase
MIYGIGCDLVHIPDIEKMLGNDHFMERVFSVEEREAQKGKRNAAQSFAADFAAKESFSKAIGTGIRGFSLTEVELLREENGKPYLRLSGKAKKIAESLCITEFHVSVSHAEDKAMCFVVAVCGGQPAT